MKNTVKVRVEIDPSCSETEVIIRTDQQSPLTERLVAAIAQCGEAQSPRITVYRDETLRMLNQSEIIRAHTEPRKLIICADSGEWEARCTLKELEEKLDADAFIRISRFEVVNINRIVRFDFSFTGTIRVDFDDGSFTWVARRYVNAIEERLSGR